MVLSLHDEACFILALLKDDLEGWEGGGAKVALSI